MRRLSHISVILLDRTCNDIRENPSQVIMQDGSTPRSDSVASCMAMLIVVLEYWQAEPKYPVPPLSRGRLRCGMERAEHFMNATDEEIIFISEMHVEG
jgi:hypothetical protein